MKLRGRIAAGLMAVAMIMGSAVPAMAAPGDITQYTKNLVLTNGANQAEYDLVQKTSISNDGKTIAKSPETVIDSITLSEDPQSKEYTMDRGHYELQPTKRAPEYALDEVAAEFDWPAATPEGSLNALADRTVTLKKNQPLTNLELTKLNQLGEGLDGVSFSLKRVERPVEIDAGDQSVATWGALDPASTYEFDTQAVDALTTGGGQFVFEGLKEGIYELTEKTTVDGYELDSRVRKVTVEIEVTQVDGKNVSTPKITHDISGDLELINYETPTIEKKIEDTDVSDVNLDRKELNVLTDYFYELKVKLPTDITTYSKAVIVDTLDARLLAPEYIKAEYTDGSGEVTIPAGNISIIDNELTVDLKDNLASLEGAKELRLVIKSQILGTALLENDIPNTFDFIYDNGKGAGEKTITSNEVFVDPTVGSVEFLKNGEIDATKEQNPLANATFRIYALDENAPTNSDEAVAATAYQRPNEDAAVLDVTTDATGIVKFESLPYGKYVIWEVEAPEGFKQLNYGIEFEINAETANPVLETVVNYEVGTIQLNTGTFGMMGLAGLGLISALAGAKLVSKKEEDKE